MIKQFLESAFCLEKCRCCCRFSEQESVWSPCLLDEEIAALTAHGISPSFINKNKKIILQPYPKTGTAQLPGHIGPVFICPFLDIESSKCAIYPRRPFECRIYPFLINRRKEKIFLSVDLGCPYVKEKLGSREFKDYAQALADLFSLPEEKERIKNNPQLIQVYEQACDLAELKI